MIVNTSNRLYQENVRLVLTDPDPILHTLSPFKKGSIPRLKADGAELDFYSFTLDAPPKEIGKRLSVNLSNQNINNASLDKKYDFDINVKNRPDDPDNWKPQISNADLDSRGVGIAFKSDSLSLTISSTEEGALSKFPIESETIYDPDKSDFDISQVEPMKTEEGDIIPYSVTEKRGLNLYWVLQRIANETGLTSITTSVPNYELTRFDKSILSSFRDSLSPFFGVFNTLWLADGNSIKIVNKSQVVPEDFEIFELTVGKFLSWQMDMSSQPKRDGFAVTGVSSDLEADDFEIETDTLPIQKSGTFGTADYQEIHNSKTYKRWFNSEFPDVTLKNDLISETRTVKAPIPPYTVTLSDIGVFETEHFYDSTGKRIRSTQEHRTRLPDVEDEGSISLTLASQTRQEITYTAHPNNSRRFIPFQVVTYKDGLVAIDEEQPYINPDDGTESAFRQEYTVMHRRGDLRFDGTMTKEFAPISQVTKTYFYLGNDQFQVTESPIYYTSGMEGEPFSEPSGGDPSISATTGKQRTVYIYRDGYVEPENGLGYGFESKSGGEVPLRFLIPEMKSQLAERFQKKQSGRVEIGGYSEDVRRGSLVDIKSRSGDSYGLFMVEGFSVTGQRLERGGWQITTRLDVAEI